MSGVVKPFGRKRGVSAGVGRTLAATTEQPGLLAQLTAIAAFACVAALLSYRAFLNLNVPGQPHAQYWALQDFRDAIYYPVVAFLSGHNPYDWATYHNLYPVDVAFPPYSPLTLVIHLPLGLLPYETAELVYYAFTLALAVVLARLTLTACHLAADVAHVFGLAALILISRPGHVCLLAGTNTLTVVVAVYVALLLAKQRPWIAGLAVAVSTLKPTFGAPLMLLLLVRGDVRPVLIGATVGGLVTACAIGVLAHAAGGVLPLLDSLRRDLPAFDANPANVPLSTITRVDAIALLGHALGGALPISVSLVIGLGIVALGAVAIHRLARHPDERAQRLATMLACMTILSCTYHQIYDALLLTWPLTLLAVGQWGLRVPLSPWLRWSLLALLAVPSVNYLTSATAIAHLGINGAAWTAVTSLNGGAVLLSLLICVVVALRET
jgi:hypothetical protein